MDEHDAAALKELFGRAGFARVLDGFEAKLVQYGGPSGVVAVESEEEAHALGGLLGRYVRRGQKLRLATIEAHLLEATRFRCTLRELVETVRGAPLVTRAEARAAEEARWLAARAEVVEAIARAQLPDDQCARLLAWAGDADGDLRRRWAKDARLPEQVRDACRCLASLPPEGRSRSLAELANAALGDPHGLDRDTSLSPLFDRLLAAALGLDYSAGGAAVRDELLAAAGVVQDRTSAKVDTFGLAGRRPDLVLLRDHPLRSFTLRELEGMAADELRAPHGRVSVVENASVFDWLVARLDALPPERRPALICTNGWLNMADRALLRMLVASGASVRYGGDFDDRGLAIARDVMYSVPGATLWCMGAADYRAAAGSRTGTLDVVATERLRSTFPELVSVMTAVGRAVYQEAVQERLLEDLLGNESRGVARDGEVKAAATNPP